MEPVTLALAATAVFVGYKWLTGGQKTAALAAVAKTPATVTPATPVTPDARANGAVVMPPTETPPGLAAPAFTVSTPPKATYPTTSDGRAVTQATLGSLDPSSRPPSPANFQWYWVVTLGQSPAFIARQITGKECDYLALLDANPTKATVGPRSCYNINFQSLLPGEVLKLPTAWNAHIAADGTRRADGGTWTGA